MKKLFYFAIIMLLCSCVEVPDGDSRMVRTGDYAVEFASFAILLIIIIMGIKIIKSLDNINNTLQKLTSEVPNSNSNMFSRTETQTNTKVKENNVSDKGFFIGQLVVDKKTENQLNILEITESGTFICRKAGTENIAGEYTYLEIEDFKRYWAKKK